DRNNNKLTEAPICYAGNSLDAGREKYDLSEYKVLASELQKAGANTSGMKEMAGTLQPAARSCLISHRDDTVDAPGLLSPHATRGNGVFRYTRAIEAGVDVVDVAAGAMAGSTSQPSAQSLYHALDGSNRQPDVDIGQYEELSKYWQGVRDYYQDFENGMKSP